MRPKLMRVGLIIACLLVMLLLLGNFAVCKKDKDEPKSCHCKPDEVCQDGECIAADSYNAETETQDSTSNEAETTQESSDISTTSAETMTQDNTNNEAVTTQESNVALTPRDEGSTVVDDSRKGKKDKDEPEGSDEGSVVTANSVMGSTVKNPPLGCPQSSGLTPCGTPLRCVNLQNNIANCGKCGNACPVGQLCQGGTCVASGCTKPCPATDSNPCTDDICVKGQCVNVPSKDGTSCFTGGKCGGGVCCQAKVISANYYMPITLDTIRADLIAGGVSCVGCGDITPIVDLSQVDVNKPGTNTYVVTCGSSGVSAFGTITIDCPSDKPNYCDCEGTCCGETKVSDPDKATTSHGTVDVNADGSYVYESDIGFCGSDSFTYQVTGCCRPGTYTETINIECPPTTSPTVITVAAPGLLSCS